MRVFICEDGHITIMKFNSDLWECPEEWEVETSMCDNPGCLVLHHPVTKQYNCKKSVSELVLKK